MCPHEVPVKEQAGNGFAQYSCQWCGYQCYARTEASDIALRKKMKPAEVAAAPKIEAEPKPAPKVEKAPEKKPAAHKSLLGF
jgi:hypothetical protein